MISTHAFGKRDNGETIALSGSPRLIALVEKTSAMATEMKSKVLLSRIRQDCCARQVDQKCRVFLLRHHGFIS